MTDKKERSSNIELLRIVAMLMIIVFHIIHHCVRNQLPNSAFFNSPALYKKLSIPQIIATMGSIGNAIFILISGYFMANRGKTGGVIDLSKISVKLLSQLGFATVTVVVASTALHYAIKDVFVNMVSYQIFNSYAWFVGYYFLIVLCGALFLNSFLAALNRKQYLTLLLTLFALISFGWTIGLLDNLAGSLSTAFTGLFLYSLGGYIQRYEPFERFHSSFLWLIIIACYALILLSQFNTAATTLSKLWESEQTPVKMSHTVFYFGNNSITSLIVAICIFELFRRLRMPHNKIINFLGSSTFMAYLIHENDFFHSFWWQYDWLAVLYESPGGFVLKCIKWTLISFACGVVAYALYLLFMRFCKMMSRVFVKKNIIINE